MKKVIKTFAFVAMLFFNITSVKATEYEENLIKKIAPDGSNATFKVVKPKSFEEADNLINSHIDRLLNDKNYSAYASCQGPNYTNCEITIMANEGEFNHNYNITITYDEPKENETINSYISKIPDFDENDSTTYFAVEDLNLINYYNTSVESELWNKGAASRALKYSNDIIKLTTGSDVKFNLEVRAGIQGDGLMYESAFGGMNIYYNNYCYNSSYQGVYLKRVIYIPENTIDTKEAYIDAAQERINKYLGNDEAVEVVYGGLLSSLLVDDLDPLIPTSSTDGNYYNVIIKERTYKFYIMKGTTEQLKEPAYLGNEIITNVVITSNEPSIPLDTSLTVKVVVDNKIKEILKTEDYKAYDINLYSDGKGTSIDKLSNGKFLVKIPVPEEYEGKKLLIYYINAQNEIKKYEVTIENNFAVFETDHFSTYILTEDIENPKTSDGIMCSILFGGISIIGMSICALFLNKKKIFN